MDAMKRQLVLWWRRLRNVASLLRHGSGRLERIEHGIGRLEQQVSGVEARFADWHAQLGSAVAVLGGKASHADLARQTQQLRDRLAAVERLLEAAPPAGPGTDAQPGRGADVAPLEQAFYLALEQQFRGTEQQIAERLAVYRPWLDALPAGELADLGCGRGEWLRLLRDWGLPAIGIDSNPLNIAGLQTDGLRGECDDALAWLRRQPAERFAAVTAFHLAEHLPFGTLLQLVDEARRVLMPGGRLIIETPNPENLDVSMRTFWLDPTHRLPLPPNLLEFVVTYCGLLVDDVPRLNDLPTVAVSGIPALDRLLAVGRDYAVIARCPPPEQRVARQPGTHHA